MSKSTTRQKVECLQGWLNRLPKKPLIKTRVEKTSLDQIVRETFKK